MTDRSGVHRDIWTYLVQEVQIGVRQRAAGGIRNRVWDAILDPVDTTPYSALGEVIYLDMERYLLLVAIGPVAAGSPSDIWWDPER